MRPSFSENHPFKLARLPSKMLAKNGIVKDRISYIKRLYHHRKGVF
jgi:hypothetical protein